MNKKVNKSNFELKRNELKIETNSKVNQALCPLE